MKLNQRYSLINDLEESLNTIFENSEYEFKFKSDDLYIDEVFNNNLFLPLFLFDKQKLLFRFCYEHLSPGANAQIILQQNKNCIFNFMVTIEHNINNYQQYISLLKFLISLILTDNCFTKKEINLIDKYKHFEAVMIKTLQSRI